MGLRINTNVQSLAAQRSMSQTRATVNDNLRKMSSGERVTRAADDAAGLAISENLKAQIRSIRQCVRNAGDAISLIQTSEGGLSEISTMVIRLRELAVQASTDTITDSERKFSNIEFQNLKDEIQRIADSSEFNGTRLLNGMGGLLEFQIGIRNNPLQDRLTYDGTEINATMMGLGVQELDIGHKMTAQNGISVLDDALVRINGFRAALGAKQNRLTSTIRNLEVTDENISAANSRIRDVDIAQETADLTKNNILLQAGAAVLSQANQTPSIALKLING
ncbi:MAG: flagellin FliC [Oligoflexia bacterium]|nr:flagellin FliC [Oligoflexia bacterium]MBF0364758.1 flagellin FliC [Oligoflexia bacterium]